MNFFEQFKQKFPSLMECKEGTLVTEDVMKCCIDKQKVMDIFDKYTLTGTDGDRYIHNYEDLLKN